MPVKVIIPLTIMDLSIWLNSFARRKKKAEYNWYFEFFFLLLLKMLLCN